MRCYSRLPKGEVFDGEIRAAWEAAKWAMTQPRGTFHFCIDNTSAIRSLLGHPSDYVQEASLGLEQAVAQLESWSVQWSLGHMEIPGNEASYSRLPNPSNAIGRHIGMVGKCTPGQPKVPPVKVDFLRRSP